MLHSHLISKYIASLFNIIFLSKAVRTVITKAFRFFQAKYNEINKSVRSLTENDISLYRNLLSKHLIKITVLQCKQIY